MEASAHRPRSRSRSRSASVNHRRRSRRSVSRSRSPSSDSRRRLRRSRSQSRSRENRRRNASPSTSPERRRKKEHKKDKKRKHKKDGKKKRREDVPAAEVMGDWARQDDVTPVDPTPAVATTKNFFAQLKQQEATKEMVGTVHASGHKPESATSLLAPGNDNWDCVKPGCGHSNMKKALSCLKCGAMRRISVWR
ncbi:hypothetical protein ACHHYP_08609 [Achlya hypogyna]|uniref:RanBP2-type domain-containing protein n=1 Tax=Achlya hypogyna TaxID=1202772 RepID=A0A1V9ZKW9_ACHHY|nr:hypothetical protein ACHHYP_08609 [Achlya hypogyna]